MWLLAYRGCVEIPVRSYRKRSDLALRSFVKNESFRAGRATLGILARTLARRPRNAEDAAAGFGSGDKIFVFVECQNANVRFLAGVKNLALTVGSYGKELALVSR